MAPRKVKPRSRKIRESFCEDLLPRKLVKETFKAQNHGGGGRRRGDGRHAALIKSRDSHMAGGEQMFVCQGTQGILFRIFRERFAKEMAKGKTE